MNLTYTTVNGVQLPNLTLPKEPEMELGKYAQLRKNFLMNHRPGTFLNLMTTGQLNRHLEEIQQTASLQVERLTNQMAREEEINENLKEREPLTWVGRMNEVKHRAEELVIHDLILI
jgi:hypothetical protein